MLFSGIKRMSGQWWRGFDILHDEIKYLPSDLATPSTFCRPATPTGSLLFAAPLPERPSDPANPGLVAEHGSREALKVKAAALTMLLPACK